MPVARKKNGAAREHRRRLARKLTGNPFSLVGSPIPDLISPDDWDGVFENNKAHLLEEAGIGRDQVWIRVGRRQPHPGRMTRAEWFAALVKSTVGTWLATAAQPRVRETFEELGALKALLALALGAPGPEAVGKAVAAYQALSSAALAAIPGPDHLARDREEARRGRVRAADAGPARPSLDQRIGAGDDAALRRLFGLIPIRGGRSLDGPRPYVQDALYQGRGTVELHMEGHPPDVRLEQLFRRLVIIHELVTGDRPRLGQHTPFYRFANALLSRLTRSNDISERGDRALERAIVWRKPLLRQHKTKKSSALPRTGKLSESPPAS